MKTPYIIKKETLFLKVIKSKIHNYDEARIKIKIIYKKMKIKNYKKKIRLNNYIKFK
jgi:hypothetical protein